MSGLQVTSLLLIAGGIAWAAYQGQKQKKKIDELPDGRTDRESDLTRVVVFERLDELREWFGEQGNAAGVDAMAKGSHALIECQCDEAKE